MEEKKHYEAMIQIECEELRLRLSVAFLLLLIRVVETVDAKDAVVDEQTAKEENETAELQIRPVGPLLSKVALSAVDGVEDEEVDHPDTGSTDGFEDGSDDGSRDVGDEHAEEVVAEDDARVEDDRREDSRVLAEHDEGVDRVFLERPGNVRDDDEQQRAHDASPQTLETDNEDGIDRDAFQQVLLNDDLRGLDDLCADDKHDADGFLRRARGGCARGGFGVSVLHKRRERDNAQRKHDCADADPVEEEQLTLEEELGEERREDDHRTTEHLPDTGGDPQQADVHRSSGTHIAARRSDNNEVLLETRAAFLIVLNTSASAHERHSFAVLAGLCVSDAAENLVDDQAASHTDEHGFGLEPRLLEKMDFVVTT